ncbi:MAG: MBL fold metallo-hydrolase [Eubacteriales bacterium]|nr:MBL fold metallo-hydrolase [Eubacteriales bacterium]
MTITYIQHSGFLAETEHALLLFDFIGGPLPGLDPEKDLVIFASHRHEDHFSPKIFELAARHPRITFILSDDIWQNRVPEAQLSHTRFVGPGSTLTLPCGGGITVTAFRSTDEGVAFMVQADGRAIYHAGDLNDWQWTGEPVSWNNNMHANYMRELARIREAGFVPDIAMLPLDGRQEELFSLGLDEFMRTVGAGTVFPMHLWGDYSLIRKFKALPCASDYRGRIQEIQAEGQSFQL